MGFITLKVRRTSDSLQSSVIVDVYMDKAYCGTLKFTNNEYIWFKSHLGKSGYVEEWL